MSDFGLSEAEMNHAVSYSAFASRHSSVGFSPKSLQVIEGG